MRTLPQQWHELNPDLRRAYAEELNFPLDVQRCCFRCVMRVSRRIGAVSPAFLKSKHLRKNNADTVWKDDEIENFKRALKENGKNWMAVASAVGSKNIKECRTFYYNYKYKYKLDQLLRLFNERCGQPRIMSDTDSDEYWNEVTEGDSEETSSADEAADNGKSSSDTTSAPSPSVKAEAEDRPTNSVASTAGVGYIEQRKLQDSRGLSGSQASLKSDYDSSATLSADEGHGEDRGRSASPSLQPRAAINSSHMFASGARPASRDQDLAHIREQAVSSSSRNVSMEGLMSQRQRVPAFLINPNAPSTPNSAVIRAESEQAKEEPTCVRDLIYQAIEMSLQTPAKTKPGDLPVGALPSPHFTNPAVDRTRDMRMPMFPVEVKHEPGENRGARPLLLPGHELHPRGYASPGNMRPEGLAMMSFSHHLGGSAAQPPPAEEETLDLSKKSTAEPPRTVTPQQRREPTPSPRDYISAMPPPAHSKHKPHSVIETPPPEPLYRGQPDVRPVAKSGYVNISQERTFPPVPRPQPPPQPQRVQMPPNKPTVPPPPLITSGTDN